MSDELVCIKRRESIQGKVPLPPYVEVYKQNIKELSGQEKRDLLRILEQITLDVRNAMS